jgi:hypothetical protein
MRSEFVHPRTPTAAIQSGIGAVDDLFTSPGTVTFATHHCRAAIISDLE